MMRFRNFCLASLAMAVISPITPALADDIRAATYLGPSNIQTDHGLTRFLPALRDRTEGRITAELFANGVLLPPRSILQGVSDNIAQIGFHTTNYTPSELPVIYALSGMGFREPDPMVLGLAFADWVMNDPAGYGDYRRHGVIPVGGFSTAPYELLCAGSPIRTLDDIRGKRLRFPGGQTALLAEPLGFTPVSIPASEMYQAMTGGQIDCTAIFATFLNVDQQLHEVTKSVTLVHLPPVFYDPMQIYNASYWQGISEQDRRSIFDLAAGAMAHIAVDFETKTADSLAFAREKGIEIIEPDASLTTTIKAWVDAGAGDMTGKAREAGIADPDALFASFGTYLDKWRPLVGGLSDRHDVDEVSRLIAENLFGKMDLATYGMD